MSEEPLHVRVAKALGCKVVEHRSLHPDYPHKIEGPITGYSCGCKGDSHSKHTIHAECCHDYEGLGCDNVLAPYDTDWSASGPLIEKYQLHVGWQGAPGEPWSSYWNLQEREGEAAQAETPLVAVCRLILKLAEGGKL